MSTSDYQASLAQINAVPLNTVRRPNMPVKNVTQEAENLHRWAQPDVELMLKAGLKRAYLDELLQRIGALREAESIWQRTRKVGERAQQQWNVESPKAYALRDSLVNMMRFAYRHDKVLLKRVAQIAAGNGHADMIQDLNDLAILGRQATEPLEAIGEDLQLLTLAAETSAAMADLLAKMTVERASNSGALLIRNQAYTLLMEAVDEIRLCGQYVNRSNAARRDGYVSEYRRSKRKGGGNKPSGPKLPLVSA